MIYLVDGSTEKSVITMMKRFDKISARKVVVCCISQMSSRQVETTVRMLTQRRKSSFVVITDSDTLTSSTDKEKLITNVQTLNNNQLVTNLTLVIQHNLEHEICKSLSLSKRGILELFNSEGTGELKKTIVSLSPENLNTKMVGIYSSDFWKSKFHGVTDETLLRFFNRFEREVSFK